MKTIPVAQIISVRTSRPGDPPPGSPKNLRGFSVFVVPCQSPATARTRALPHPAHKDKKTRVFVVKNSPQIPAPSHPRPQIFTKHFSKIFANCSLNNAICASTIQRCGKGMSPDANGLGLHCLPRATCPNPRRPVPVETIQLSRCLIALPDPSPQWQQTVGPAQPSGVDADVPHGSQRPPPNRAPTAGVWRQGVRPFRDFPTPEPHSRLRVVSPGDPAFPGSLACRWRTANSAATRLGPSAQPPPGPLYVTSDRDAPAARPGPSRHRPARGLHTFFPSPFMEREMPPGQRVRSNELPPPAPVGAEGAGMLAGHNFNPVGVPDLSLGKGDFNELPP